MDEPDRQQRRGDHDAYRRYLDGMDASMRQKVALTAAHLLCEGRVADMGMGSGSGSHALAALYPGLEIVGVDVSETMVSLANERYRLPNLSFRVGDVAQPVFPAGSLDGIFDSSVLHHVTSFGAYDHDAAARALETQAAQLREGGVLVVRDFLDPGPGECLLELRDDDGDASDDPRRCSSARLFERFAGEFRKLSPTPGFAFTRVGPTTVRLSRKHAVEFLLRKDYRADWESEVLEEYTYFTQAQFEALFARLGLRMLASVPLKNPWIVRHRFEGRCALFDADDGTRLPWPATNYLIAGERIAPGEGVGFVEAAPAPRLGFLEMAHFRNERTGQVLDLVRRPHLTLDVLPWFPSGPDLFVLARRSYPRPILQCARRGNVSLDGRRSAGYVTEPLSLLQGDKPVGQTVEEGLARLAHLDSDAIRGFVPGASYYPSPGGIQEEVRSLLVEIEPRFVERRLDPVSGFRSSGMVRAIEARQVLRAAQVGGLPDARLELNVYRLLAHLGLDAGPWIGEELQLGETSFAPAPTALATLRQRPLRRLFRRADAQESSGFLEIGCATFEERDAAGETIARRDLELVVPRTRGFATIATAPLCRRGAEIYLGIDDDDLPAAQGFAGNSQLLVAPAWRVPRELTNEAAARAWVTARLAAEYGVTCGAAWELGGPYHPSAGVTPEVVHPLAIEILGEAPGTERRLTWVSLRELLIHEDLLVDGHLRILAQRAAHALGLLTVTSA